MPVSCSKCGRYAAGNCDICGEPTCNVHTANAESLGSFNSGGSWYEVAARILDARTVSETTIRSLASALDGDLRLTHLQCRIDDAMAKVNPVVHEIPDPVTIASTLKRKGRPFDQEVWTFHWKGKWGRKIIRDRLVVSLWTIEEHRSSRIYETATRDHASQAFTVGLGLDAQGKLWSYKRDYENASTTLDWIGSNDADEVRQYDYQAHYEALRSFMRNL